VSIRVTSPIWKRAISPSIRLLVVLHRILRQLHARDGFDERPAGPHDIEADLAAQIGRRNLRRLAAGLRLDEHPS
jgi:hypothetical protein